MSLTAREWLLLPEDEQQQRGKELSPHECFLLRTELSYIHFSEEEKRNMPKEKREKFLHPREISEEEREQHSKERDEIFKQLMDGTKGR